MTHRTASLIESLHRLAALHHVLSSGRVSIEQLATAAGVPTRTTQRDLDVLRELGAPVVLDKTDYTYTLSTPWDLWKTLQSLVPATTPIPRPRPTKRRCERCKKHYTDPRHSIHCPPCRESIR